jgi:hypothetical protein
MAAWYAARATASSAAHWPRVFWMQQGQRVAGPVRVGQQLFGAGCEDGRELAFGGIEERRAIRLRLVMQEARIVDAGLECRGLHRVDGREFRDASLELGGAGLEGRFRVRRLGGARGDGQRHAGGGDRESDGGLARGQAARIMPEPASRWYVQRAQPPQVRGPVDVSCGARQLEHHDSPPWVREQAPGPGIAAQPFQVRKLPTRKQCRRPGHGSPA